jgi:hypothetical protein
VSARIRTFDPEEPIPGKRWSKLVKREAARRLRLE